MHRNSERFRINTGCPAVEPTEITQEVIAAAGELGRELQRACRAFYPNIYGKLEVSKSMEWQRTKSRGLIIKVQELWHVRQAGDEAYRFCLVYWKSELPPDSSLRSRAGRTSQNFRPLASSWRESNT